ncbi:HNH endonuclease [Streptomyces sp. NBC_01768]|uniref:HNH endonuclease n=1 Tax=Streptomyces sp. NBC_01768 TaxID=2975938 RepID=UPI002DD7A836|nr:HNH endonuclease signature motif containing protein [Streptomyces sp. NBC_01768]WSC31843.1 HNH endonuclease [Streptomyces sp. NBC_01768]
MALRQAASGPRASGSREVTTAALAAAWGDAELYQCFYCGGAFTDADPCEVEHVHPRAAGGRDELSNLVPAHRSCNHMKGDGDAMAFWRSMMADRGYDVDALLTALA